METCKTFDLIPVSEIVRVFTDSNSASAEMDKSFLCFEEVYEKVSNYTDENTIILDFGCSYMAQAYWFTHCKQYIGIDLPFRSNVKFRTCNSELYLMSGQEFIKEILPTLNLDMDNVIAICSYVPDEELEKMVSETFKYNYVQYCNEIKSNTLPAKELKMEKFEKEYDFMFKKGYNKALEDFVENISLPMTEEQIGEIVEKLKL